MEDYLYYCSDETVSESNSAIDSCKSIVIIDMQKFAKNVQPTFEVEKYIAFADYLTSGYCLKKSSKKSEYALDSKKSYTFENIVEYDNNCRNVNGNDFKENSHVFTENDNKFIATIAFTNTNVNSNTDLVTNGNKMLHSNKCSKTSVVDLILEDFNCTSSTSPIKTMDNLPHSPLFILLEKPKRFYSRYTNSKSKVNSNKNLLNDVQLINTEILSEMDNDDQNSMFSLLSVEEVCQQSINSVNKISFTGSQCLYENLLHLSMHFNCADNNTTNNNSSTSEYSRQKQSSEKLNVDEIPLIRKTSQRINFRAQEMKIQPDIHPKDFVIYVSPRLSELMSNILFLQKKFAHSWEDVSYNSNSNKGFYGFSSANEDNVTKTISTSFNLNDYLLQSHRTVEQNTPAYLNQTENNIDIEFTMIPNKLQMNQNIAGSDWWNRESDGFLASLKFQDIRPSLPSTQFNQSQQVTSEEMFTTNIESDTHYTSFRGNGVKSSNNPDCAIQLKDIAKPVQLVFSKSQLNECKNLHVGQTTLKRQTQVYESSTCERMDYFKDNEFVEREPMWDDDNCEFWLNFRTQEVMDIENIISAETQSKLTWQSHQYDNQLEINIGLQTASGKRLDVSSKAREAVQHLVSESFSNLGENATNYEKVLQATKMKIKSKAQILKIAESENNISEKTPTCAATRPAYPHHEINRVHALNFEDNTEGINLIDTEALINSSHKVVSDIFHSEILNKSNNKKKIVEIKSHTVNARNYEVPGMLDCDKELRNNLFISPNKSNVNYNESIKSNFVLSQISKSESILNEKNCLEIKAEKQKVIKELINYDAHQTLNNILQDLDAMKSKTCDFSNTAIFTKKHGHNEYRKHNDYYINKEVTPSNLKDSSNIHSTEYIGGNNIEITSITDSAKGETLQNTLFHRNYKNDANNCLSIPNISYPYINDTSISAIIPNESSIIGRKNLMSLSKKLKRRKERASHQINDSEINRNSSSNIDDRLCVETPPKHTLRKTTKNYQTPNCTPDLQYFISNASTCSTPTLKQAEYHRLSYSVNGSQLIDWNNDNEYDKSITKQSLDNFNKYNTFANNGISNIPKHLTIEQLSATQLEDFSATSVTSLNSAIPLNTSPFVLSTALTTSISKDNKQKNCRPSGLKRTRSAQKRSKFSISKKCT